MKVLVATNEGQGTVDGDYSATVDGELVYVQALTCADPACGCDRGFAGMSSSRATTTAKVVERPEMTVDAYRQALADSLTRGGWIRPDDRSADTVRFLDDVFTDLTWITDQAEVGSHVRRKGDQLFFDRPATAA
ncbi:MAG: hypothetical protein R2695_02975 [Acidimicrobiales bacterium]